MAMQWLKSNFTKILGVLLGGGVLLFLVQYCTSGASITLTRDVWEKNILASGDDAQPQSMRVCFDSGSALKAYVVTDDGEDVIQRSGSAQQKNDCTVLTARRIWAKLDVKSTDDRSSCASPTGPCTAVLTYRPAPSGP